MNLRGKKKDGNIGTYVSTHIEYRAGPLKYLGSVTTRR